MQERAPQLPGVLRALPSGVTCLPSGHLTCGSWGVRGAGCFLSGRVALILTFCWGWGQGAERVVGVIPWTSRCDPARGQRVLPPSVCGA